NTMKDKEAEALWGGRCILGNVFFVVTAPDPRYPDPINPKPKDKPKDKPTKEDEFGKHGDLGLGDGDGGKK
ncbi:MAG: hypothetical protein L6R42_010164, partial [Xanthoria sp. 1 TBL-2021]